ncbi:MAG: glycerol-3-phosphate dehydrogenase [Robiginitomaculum sp.]
MSKTDFSGASYDLLIVGGGINGAAIARDAAGRGLSVLLCEKDDLANHTSSSSTKLIHGGLRYLEHYEFRLVREALIEREVLLRAAPHIIWPMRFVLPYDKGLRPAWMLRIGLFMYDYMGGRKMLPPTKVVRLNKAPHKDLLEDRLKFGYEYSDCWVQDTRLTILNAVDAMEHGAIISTRTKVLDIRAKESSYEIDISKRGGATQTVTAKGIINSAGPWVEEVLTKIGRKDKGSGVRLIKGSHLITRQLFSGDKSYIFQNGDGRIIFAIPYEKKFTLIGTTDEPYDPSEGPAKISPKETRYLIDAANEYFKDDISEGDIIGSYSGVRPLYDDKAQSASAVTRDYVLELEDFADGAPFLSVFGGKITTSRKLAEHALQKLEKYYTFSQLDWTAKAHLPGGDIDKADFYGFFEQIRAAYPDFKTSYLFRLARCYGTRMAKVIGDAKVYGDMGEDFGGGLTAREVDYLVANEFATSAQDVVERRTKLSLHMSQAEQAAFKGWFAKNHADLG